MEIAAPFSVVRYPRRYPGELLRAFQRDLLDAFTRLDAAGGDAVTARVGPRSLVFLRHPDLVRALLIEQNAAFTKARGLRLAKRLIGEGLLTSEPPLHERQRRLMLPAFHHRRLRAYARTMTALADAEADAWTPGAPLDVGRAMSRLTLAVAGQTLFGADVADEADAVGHALATALHSFDRSQVPGSELLEWLPLPRTLRFRRARATLDRLVYRLIRERRAAIEAGGDPGEDLLGMLLAARDEEDGSAMTDRQVRDEALTLLLAGHETTANALAWTLALLAEHPAVEERLHAEVDAALGGRAPTFDDLPRLPYTRQVFAEAMRLYPPAWVVGRQAARDVDLGGLPVARGDVLLFGPYFLHRDPRFWDDPARFDPARFGPEARAERHKFAYLPFSAGRRGCIGEQFAWTEGVLVLAALARRRRLHLTGPMPAPHGSVTLRPKTPLVMVTEVRA